MVLTFETLSLPKPLLNALADLELEYPTPIQIEAYPAILSGRDVIGIAQTGTGKTFAYLLPLLAQYKFSDQKDPRILILVPTRELVVQITREVEKLTRYMNVRITGIYGGTNINTQKQTVYEGMDILVATPGRLWDLAMSGILRLKSVKKLVIDEVDEMLNLGFRSQLISILDVLPSKRQNLMFSATLKEDVQIIVQDSFQSPFVINIAPQGTPADKITQWVYHVPNFMTKVALLEYLLNNDKDMAKVLVFVKSKKLADKLYETMIKVLPDMIGVMHSNKSQQQRLNALNRFTSGEYRLLISTDLVARGLDIFEVSHVINFDMSEVPGDYIHRIGRTGRADKEGIVYSFVNDEDFEYLREIENMLHKTLPISTFPEEVQISSILLDEEKSLPLYDKDYLKNSYTSKRKPILSDIKGKKNKNLKESKGKSHKGKSFKTRF